jgi:hypothetical protein
MDFKIRVVDGRCEVNGEPSSGVIDVDKGEVVITDAGGSREQLATDAFHAGVILSRELAPVTPILHDLHWKADELHPPRSEQQQLFPSG